MIRKLPQKSQVAYRQFLKKLDQMMAGDWIRIWAPRSALFSSPLRMVPKSAPVLRATIPDYPTDFCPITAICQVTKKRTLDSEEVDEAARICGITQKLRDLIVASADDSLRTLAHHNGHTEADVTTTQAMRRNLIDIFKRVPTKKRRPIAVLRIQCR